MVGGNVVLAMTDDDGRNPRPPITLGPGGAATSTTLNGRHFVVANNAGALEGYFVDGAGTVSPPVALGNGSGARLASVGDKAVLTYSHTDPDTGKTSSYARVVNPDGSTGPELRINDADALNDNSVQDIDILRNPDGSLTNQVMISWKNSAGNGTLLAETFTVTGGSLTGSGGANMEFVSNIAGHGLGPNNIAVLNDGTVIGNWQEDVGGIDFNALGIFKVRWGGGELRIDTQEKAQKMLDNIDAAIVRKDSIRAHLGALQNRLENTISNLNIQAENLQTAESRISDTDVATEMTEFARTQILTQSATAMLAQANSLPKMALQVIQS